MGITTVSKVIFILFFCELICSKKLSLPDLDNSKIGECKQCKVLTDSVDYWLAKTARGKFEGGDTAWEESKLKSYARSEIRLVEVQEGLCSEVSRYKEQCYALAEEAEQIIEDWWFKENPDSIDLYTGLCIETLKLCCPKNHYGENCSPCVLNNNIVCSGHGKCQGDGTRKGNGTCVCKKGYSGATCDTCAKNFYSINNGLCEPCHKACDECKGEGPNACDRCQSGWQDKFGVCLDLNECLDSSKCSSNEYCINTEGSYSCKLCDDSCKTCLGPGTSNCTSCVTDKLLWSGNCIDDTMKSDILKETLKRTAMYTGLLVITFIILRNSRMLASMAVLLIAVYIYFLEKSSKINLADVLVNMYL